MLKKRVFTTCLIVLAILSVSGMAFASYTDEIRKVVPESWFENPKTASEIGINEFHQAPMLDDLVAQGKLPPVEERLPNDPMVIEPTYNIGEYGGTWVSHVNKEPMSSIKTDLNITRKNLFRVDPFGTKLKPDIIKGWTYNDNATELTLYFRKGLKWSDGYPFSADDFMYYWNAELNKKELNPIPPSEYKPVGWSKVEKIDDYTVTIYFDAPNLMLMRNVKNRIANMITANQTCAHYMKQFHPDYGNKEEINKLVKKEGFDTWYELYQNIEGRNMMDKYPVPSVGPYIYNSETPNSILMVRNPYFAAVDTEGNQLPYIDQVRVIKVESDEISKAKAATGEETMDNISLPQMPLFQEQAKKENFHIIFWKDTTNFLTYMPNMTHKNPQIRKIIQNVKFREALSLAINRDEISKTLFFGQAIPSANTIAHSSEYYKDSYQKYIEYDPQKATSLLDEIGVVDSNGDGWREQPNGDKLLLTLEVIDKDVTFTKINQMVVPMWQDLGLNIKLKFLDWGLWSERANGNSIDITGWPYDQNLGLSFGSKNPTSAFVPNTPFIYFGSQWIGWANWYVSDGKEGMEPPAEIKDLLDQYEKVAKTKDAENIGNIADVILQANADNIWTIGTFTGIPAPQLINNNLKNVPQKYYYSYALGSNMYPEVFYFEGGKAAK